LKGCLKPAVTLVGIALILGAVATLLLASQADTYLKWGVEKAVTKAAGAPAHIERFEILPMRQSVLIEGLVLDNPAGWKAEPALDVKSVLVNFDAKTLFSENPRIRSIDISGATANLRYDLARGINLDQLAKAAAKHASGEPIHALGRRFQVDACRCRDVKLCVAGGLLPGKMVSLDLAPFTLEDLAKKPVSIGEATGIFLRSVLTETLTLKGLLNPVSDKIQAEIRQWLGQNAQ